MLEVGIKCRSCSQRTETISAGTGTTTVRNLCCKRSIQVNNATFTLQPFDSLQVRQCINTPCPPTTVRHANSSGPHTHVKTSAEIHHAGAWLRHDFSESRCPLGLWQDSKNKTLGPNFIQFPAPLGSCTCYAHSYKSAQPSGLMLQMIHCWYNAPRKLVIIVLGDHPAVIIHSETPRNQRCSKHNGTLCAPRPDGAITMLLKPTVYTDSEPMLRCNLGL
jgi:hypothetical protein